jgi:hypothetical protein
LHAPTPPEALSQQRFAAEFGPVACHDLDRAFEGYLAWLENPIEGDSADGASGRV